jgi:EmrB/QacA subfamily drug resistance transporter
MNQRGKWAILSGVILAMLLSSLDQTIVSTAMPTIAQELHGIEHISWVFTAYMLGSTVTVPIYGKLSDIFGRRNLYLIGIGIFLFGSILCGLAQNMTQLILFRGLQGIGGGAMMVNSFAIIGDVFPPAERGKYQGMIGGVFGLSSVAGPLLGGWITDHTSWRWVFYVNVPLGLIAIAVLASALPKIAGHVRNKKIDWWGGFFILTTLVPLLLAMVWGGSIYQWSSWQVIASLTISIISLIIFIRIEKRTTNPILSLGLFKNKVFLVSVCALFLTSMGMFGAILYVPVFSQGVIGGSATHAGLILTPMMIALVIASTLSGRIISKTGRYKVSAIVGTAIIVFALFFFSTITEHTTNKQLIIRMIILGIGLGSTMPIFTLAVQSAFSKERLGEVTAGSQLFRSVGGTVGTAVLGGIMNSRLTTQMEYLKNDPFVVQLAQLNPGNKTNTINGSIIQGMLNPENQEHIRTMITKLPSPAQANASSGFTHFINASKIAFSGAIDNVFLVAGFLMSASLIIVFFLPEVPLRKAEHTAMQEAGVMLEDELGQSDDENQPRAQENTDFRAANLEE